MLVLHVLASLSIVAQTWANGTNGSDCCNALKRRLGPKVSFPGSPTYENQQNGTIDGYWSAQEIAVMPTCRFTPTSVEDVSAAVVLLSDKKCRFAVRGGGHMSFAGAANIQDGVTVDLGAMNRVQVSKDRRTTEVGAGARWGNVSSKLDGMGLAVVGGRVDGVGVGGLTLGGGISYFSPRYGFTCDNVRNFEVVLASGKVVQVNPRSHPDLYRALRGGSNNFGIVTRFNLKTFEQGKVWGGIISYAYGNVSQQTQYVTDFTTNLGQGGDPYASMETTFLFNATGGVSAGNILGYTKDEPFPAIFKNFTDAGPRLESTLRSTTLHNLTVEAGAGIPNRGRYAFSTATFANNATLLANLVQLAERTLKSATKGTAFYSFVLEPLARTILRPGTFRNGGNSLGLPADEDLMLLDLTAVWTLPEDDKVVIDTVETFLARAEEYTKAEGQYKPFVYLNYALPGQDPIASYGERNVKFLRQVSKKYDSKRVFQELVPGGFKL